MNGPEAAELVFYRSIQQNRLERPARPRAGGTSLDVYSSLVMKLSAHDLDWPGKNSAPLYSEGMKPVIGITFLSP